MTIDADRLNQIRKRLASVPLPRDSDMEFLLAALDAAEQRAEGVDRVTKRMREAEARVAQAEQERDLARSTAAACKRSQFKAEQERDKAQAKVAFLANPVLAVAATVVPSDQYEREKVARLTAEARATKATNALVEFIERCDNFGDDWAATHLRAVLADLAAEEAK